MNLKVEKKSWPDEKLVQAYMRGDMDGFTIIYQRYQTGIFFLTRRYFPEMSHAEEVFQEVFCKIVKKLPSYQHIGSFKAWLFTLTRNYCIDILRSRRYNREINFSSLENDEMGSLLEKRPIETNTLSIEINLYNEELVNKMNQALAELPEEQREVFVLKEREGFTFEEIAKMTENSINTVKSRMRYALQALRRSLKNRDFVKEAVS